MIERRITVGPFQCNCWILACPATGEAAVIDPGDDSGQILKAIHDLRTPAGTPLRVRALLHTHAHLDHFGATREVCESLARQEKPRIGLHPSDEPLWRSLRQQGEMFGIHYDDPLPVDLPLNDGDEVPIGTLRFRVIHTPGHSPGGISLHVRPPEGEETVYTGDALFQGSVGRTDLWGGNMEKLVASIRERLFILPDGTRVCPGHGPESRIGIEKRENPYL